MADTAPLETNLLGPSVTEASVFKGVEEIDW